MGWHGGLQPNWGPMGHANPVYGRSMRGCSRVLTGVQTGGGEERVPIRRKTCGASRLGRHAARSHEENVLITIPPACRPGAERRRSTPSTHRRAGRLLRGGVGLSTLLPAYRPDAAWRRRSSRSHRRAGRTRAFKAMLRRRAALHEVRATILASSPSEDQREGWSDTPRLVRFTSPTGEAPPRTVPNMADSRWLVE